jgi:hypothetical protein
MYDTYTIPVNITNDKEAFEYITQSLLNQGCKAFDEDNETCAYLVHSPVDDTYTRCAVGQIVEGRFYHRNLEGDNIASAITLAVVLASNPNWQMTVKSASMLGMLQIIHDSSDDYRLDQVWRSAFDLFMFDENNNFTGLSTIKEAKLSIDASAMKDLYHVIERALSVYDNQEKLNELQSNLDTAKIDMSLYDDWRDKYHLVD